MFSYYDDETLIPFDGKVKIEKLPTRADKKIDEDEEKEKLKERVKDISKEQAKLFADGRYAILLIFQALDAAGKDSTIKAVLSGVNPAGCSVHSFNKPSLVELKHDFLWRTTLVLPERGKIGVFNRSYYEEVLVVRVHPELLDFQNLPYINEKKIWQERLESIVAYEKHLALNGTVILKFFLNVSKEEQKARFLARLEDPRKNWKFEKGDLTTRQNWEAYHNAYQDVLNTTSKEHAPWYAIPADNKEYMRAKVAKIIAKTLKSLELKFPQINPVELAEFEKYKTQLNSELHHQ